MSYRDSAKTRKIKRFFLQILSILKFEGLNITNPLKVVLIGTLIAVFGLFSNWFDSYDGLISGNSFHKLLGISGYILFLINIKILFFIFGQKTKEVIKNYLHFYAKDSVIIIMLVLFGLIVSINAIFIIENLAFFKEGVILGKGLVFVIVGYILGVIGGIFNLFSKTKTSIYVENYNFGENNLEGISEIENKNNMKLPF